MLNKSIFIILLFLATNSIYAQDGYIGEISWIEGLVKIEYPNKEPEDAKIGMAVFLNAIIKTEDNSKAIVRLSDGTILSVAPKTKILLESLYKTQDKREASVLTFFGKIRAVVKKQMGSKSKFEFKSKTAIAGVRGTHLALDVADDGTTKVYLIGGFVGVYNRDKMDLPEIMLSEGTFTEVKEGQAPTPPQPIPSEVLQDIYQKTSIMAMIKDDFRKTIERGSNVTQEIKVISPELEERLLMALREAEKEENLRRGAYSQSLTEPLREQDIQGVVTPMDFVGGVNYRRVDVDVLIDISNY